ncbi:NADP-dependent 3-hydroxy acid dehydrogenase YdfG [Arboricoccus pini]|uniref:NADP-dependent 3-hydroxy acid dehydrogenase YdfG n=1 Tax=Arboricoccus pini TaxID=1963835 RepID=A0A212RVN6_9PROT|nr:SDR family NAD(P)-dependent oxidoreductase [Arboricoccus pini]SNB76734.1 NADP-dependent 3-hydroxy acid dehydrogenase YdfG [Arboricoccus pini]
MSEQRVVMISGASRGIGKTIARHLGHAGWRLSLGARDVDTLAQFRGPSVLTAAYDALDRQSEKAWAAATRERFGRIDALILNAGIMVPKSVVEVADEEFDRMAEVNVNAPLRLARAAWPDLLASGKGRIVVVASLSGKRVKSASSGAYAMTKFAALGLAHALRHAGFEQGVRCTALCPGFVATDMAMSLTGQDPASMTQPEDLARITAMLLDLPNTASIAEIPVNCRLDDSF